MSAETILYPEAISPGALKTEDEHRRDICAVGRWIHDRGYVASTDGKRYRDTVSVAYAMTKHAVLALTHAAKFAGWEKGVRVTALCPGAVDTELVASIPGVTPSANRLAPETVAETVAFLLRLPNTASVAEMVMNTRLETWI